MKPDKAADIEQRKKDSWWNVELFRLAHGRLPNQTGDSVTKMTAKVYLDKFHFGGETFPKSNARKDDMDKFAFHVYASTNLAYENDLNKNCPDCGGVINNHKVEG